MLERWELRRKGRPARSGEIAEFPPLLGEEERVSAELARIVVTYL